ncbi:hypothetical protein [Acinetobacter pittii]|uniref:hypothetical protein n=1 Tax=Acinetobacter pittii TaxID=48296 RepID=UPI00301C7291
MKIKIPTYEDYYNHTGLHYKNLWKSIGDEWSCPACGRSKYQIMKWSKRFPNSPNSFMDWVAALHNHHDHSVGFSEIGQRRFSETLICGQCNAAEGVVKRKLKLPSNFSFSPQEMRTFIQATPHDKHVIDFEGARIIYNSILSDKKKMT